MDACWSSVVPALVWKCTEWFQSSFRRKKVHKSPTSPGLISDTTQRIACTRHHRQGCNTLVHFCSNRSLCCVVYCPRFASLSGRACTSGSDADTRFQFHQVFAPSPRKPCEFNQSLKGVTLPSSLQTLNFGKEFNQSLEGVTMPSSLQTLTFGDWFDKSLEGVTLPSSLKTLTFGDAFDQSLEGVALPSSLQTLTFGDAFDQSLEGVTLPSSLQTLAFGSQFDQSRERVTLPSSLKSFSQRSVLVSSTWSVFEGDVRIYLWYSEDFARWVAYARCWSKTWNESGSDLWQRRMVYHGQKMSESRADWG